MKKIEEQNIRTGRSSLNMRSIFRYMMEEGYYPKFEKTHILFDFDDNVGVVEYHEGILIIRMFFTIEPEAYDFFLEASNATMVETFAVKPAILDDRKNIMFSCEMICDNLRDMRRFFPRGIERLREALAVHRSEMKKAIISDSLSSSALTGATDFISSGDKAAKPFS